MGEMIKNDVSVADSYSTSFASFASSIGSMVLSAPSVKTNLDCVGNMGGAADSYSNNMQNLSTNLSSDSKNITTVAIAFDDVDNGQQVVNG